MEKAVNQQIIELLKMMNQGLSYIEQSQNSKIETKLQVINDCIACIEPMANTLLQTDGAEEKILNAIQELKKSIEIIKFALKESQAIAMKTFAAKKQILKIKKQIEAMQTKNEIVFLPYKASMWDSLESIWRAAAEDENCNAYVIPIPYCDRNPDGSVAKWHYEGNEFPKDVPITDWQEYDLAERKPDVIYIHNPYDDYNRVTSVHPNYYSRELKKYTNMLVYVPYFVSMDNIANHFINVPGVKNSDKVIVQSEKIKKEYIKCYNEKKHLKTMQLAEKFLALGSPKVDKVMKNDFSLYYLPDEWKELIGKKKVILYNTHLDSLISNPEKILKKLLYVFEYFRDNNDFILWWRPHPLSNATIKSMRPKILEDYLKIENKYRKEKFGIFDDSMDVHRAIAVSDAYYGDGSSLVPMYGLTGKPIMIQDVNINVKLKDKATPFCISYSTDEDFIWFSLNFCLGICKMNMKNGEINEVIIIPSNKKVEVNQYLLLEKINDKMIIPPFLSNSFIEYDMQLKSIKKIKLKSINKKVMRYKFKLEPKFEITVKYKEKIFFIGAGYPAIICYNYKKNEYKYYTDWFDKICRYISDKKDDLFGYRGNPCVRDNLLFIPFHQKNIIMEFNMENGENHIYFVGDKINKYSSIVFNGNDYWITLRNKCSILKWNYKSGKTQEYSLLENQDKTNNFIGMIEFDNCLILVPEVANMIFVFDCLSGKIIKTKELPYQWCVLAKKINDKEICLFVIKKGKSIFVKVNIYDLDVNEFEISVSYALIKRKIIDSLGYNEKLKIEDYILKEDYLKDLNVFCNWTLKRSCSKNREQIEVFKNLFSEVDGVSGYNIHRYILEKCEVYLNE